MQNYSFDTIGVIIRQHDEKHAGDIVKVCNSLAHYGNLLVHFLDSKNCLNGYPEASLQQIGENAQVAVSVGGDGTLLSAARSLIDYQIPLFGINLGRLGFLADVTIENLEHDLDDLFNGRYREEQRFLLEGDIVSAEQTQTAQVALNDIILHSYETISMIEFEVYCDGNLINRQRADGLIVSTPTGSTAYSLSGGGPIVHPTLNALILVPICPHTLTQRPIVLPSEQQIEIRFNQPDGQGLVSFDGRNRALVHSGDLIRVRRHAQILTVLHPVDYDYFQILRAKLKWSNNP